jgi:hypothetical protein
MKRLQWLALVVVVVLPPLTAAVRWCFVFAVRS